LSSQVRCWDTESGSLLWQRIIEDGFNLRGLSFSADRAWLLCSHATRREFPVSRENIEAGWVIDSRLTRLAVKPDATPALQQVALDTRGAAVGDPDGIAVSEDGRWLAVAAAGTHELLLLQQAGMPWRSADPGNFIDPKLGKDSTRFRRIPLGGRPLAIRFRNRGMELVVANDLLDAVQIVDATAGKVVRTITLGGPTQPSPARQGEAIFYDARRSHNQWFSCHTCHVDGHTCGKNFDTLNDDSYGNPKLTPTLRQVTHTGPWTWQGWQQDLGKGIEKSLTETMFGPKPSEDDIKALLAFVEALEHPPRPTVAPGKPRDAVRRGQAIFADRARCGRCHRGDHYTSDHNYDLKLASDGSPYKLWNPPSLLGLTDRGPYLHDGRARTLDELLRKYYVPQELGGEPLSSAEREDLIAFLKSL
jgi:cytochrome c peroxidase